MTQKNPPSGWFPGPSNLGQNDITLPPLTRHRQKNSILNLSNLF